MSSSHRLVLVLGCMAFAFAAGCAGDVGDEEQDASCLRSEESEDGEEHCVDAPMHTPKREDGGCKGAGDCNVIIKR